MLRRILTAVLCVGLCCMGQTTPAKKKPAAKKSPSKRPARRSAGGAKSAGAKKGSGKRRARSAPLKPLPPPDPIHVPIEAGDMGAFYQALADKTGVVRILQFGDSHVAADILTRDLRESFQERFGDAGAGLVLPGSAFRGYRRAGVVVKAPVKNWQPLTLRAAPEDGLLGLPGAALRAKAVAGDATATSRFSSFELQVAAETNEEACVDVSVDDAAVETNVQQVDGPYGKLTFVANRDPLPLDTHTLKVTPCGGSPRLIGLDLRTGTPGVIYDGFGINGAQFLDLQKIAPGLRKDLIARLNPALIIVSYGTNEMGRKGLDAGQYRAECVRLLKDLRAEAGTVPVLVTGPLDRPGRSTKSRELFRERSEIVISTLKAAAAETGCSFWDTRAAMGGFGAMLRWRRSAMAQPDMVHLTGTGYKLIAKMLFDEILAGAPATAP